MDQAARCGGRYPADGTGADCVPKAGASIYNPPQRQDPFKDQIMDERLAHDPIITRFRAALDDIYGARLERVVLFGSRARGEARPDSDYDVAVFLRSLPDRWRELDRLADLRVPLHRRHRGFFRRPALPHVFLPGRHAADVRNPP